MIEPKPEDLLPSIFQYLESAEIDKISTKDLQDIVVKIQVETGLNKELADIIVKMFFHEIRNGMLAGDVVDIGKLGSFLVKNPHNSKNKEYILPKFENSANLLKRLNERK